VHHATETKKTTKTTKTTQTTEAPAGNGSPGKQTTKIVYLAPVDAHGNLVAGLSVSQTLKGNLCGAGSEGVTTTTAYRCFAGNWVLDPCWAGAGSKPAVYCVNFPWSKTVTRVTLGSLDGSAPAPATSSDLGHPWGVQLTDGKQCIAAQGARLVVGNQAAMYECGFTATSLELLGSPDRSASLWTFQTVYLKGDKIVHGPTVQVATAWYGEAHQ
jgi:hypothetical protein